MFGIHTHSDIGQVPVHDSATVLSLVREASTSEWYDGTIESLVSRHNELSALVTTVTSAISRIDPSNRNESRNLMRLESSLKEIKESARELQSAIEEIHAMSSGDFRTFADVAEIHPYSDKQTMKSAGLTFTRDDSRLVHADLDSRFLIEADAKHFGHENVELYGSPSYFRECATDYAISQTNHVLDAELRSQVVSAFVRRASVVAAREFSLTAGE